MPKPGDLIVVSAVEPLSAGTDFKRRRLEWPLHITLVPWFSGADVAQLQVELQRISEQLKPFQATVGPEAFFGPAADVPVNVIDNQEVLQQLHAALYNAVRAAGGRVEHAHWAGHAYTAHITAHGEHRCYPGDTKTIAAFQLVQLVPVDTCRVIADFIFAGRTQ